MGVCGPPFGSLKRKTQFVAAFPHPHKSPTNLRRKQSPLLLHALQPLGRSPGPITECLPRDVLVSFTSTVRMDPASLPYLSAQTGRRVELGPATEVCRLRTAC